MENKFLNNTLLNAALIYAENGWPIVPLRPNGKSPLVKGWHKELIRDPLQIIELWKQYPNANVGIVTGKASELFVIDVDHKGSENGFETLQKLEQVFGRFDTLRSNTQSGGLHLLFRYPSNAIGNKVRNLIGIDVRSDGGYIVAPPSVINDKGYHWRDPDIKPEALPIGVMDVLEFGAEMLPPVGLTEGHRNDGIFQYALKLRQCKSQESAEWLIKKAANLCNPLLGEAEALQCLQSAMHYEVKGQPATSAIAYRRMSEIESQPISWLWPNRIACGKISLIVGNPGKGKSQLTIAIAGIVSTGGKWPVDGISAEQGNVIFLSAEDDAADTIKPRLEAVGADVSMVYILEAVVDTHRSRNQVQRRTFSLKDDLCHLETMLEEIGGASLLIIDPISAYLGDADSHKNADIRALFAPLSEFAAKHNMALICVSHLNKSTDSEALFRVMGSLAFVAAARAAYLVSDDKEDQDRRLLLPIKNNIGNDKEGYAFTIQGVILDSGISTSRAIWADSIVTTSAEEAMQSNDRKELSLLEEARSFLINILSEGALPAKEVYKQADDAGIARRTVRRAQEILGIKPKKQDGKGGRWLWELDPNLVDKSQHDQHSQHDHQVSMDFKNDPNATLEDDLPIL